MTNEQDTRPHIDILWPVNVMGKPNDWEPMRCGVNSEGTQPIYGPFPKLPRAELGDQTGERHEVFFRCWYAQQFPFGVYQIHVRRTFRLTEPTPGVLEWVEES